LKQILEQINGWSRKLVSSMQQEAMVNTIYLAERLWEELVGKKF
jgi:hypothetical protein